MIFWFFLNKKNNYDNNQDCLLCAQEAHVPWPIYSAPGQLRSTLTSRSGSSSSWVVVVTHSHIGDDVYCNTLSYNHRGYDAIPIRTGENTHYPQTQPPAIGCDADYTPSLHTRDDVHYTRPQAIGCDKLYTFPPHTGRCTLYSVPQP